MSKQMLVVFAKEPRAGRVKTRLAHETSAEFAAAVALALLRDTLERFALIQSEHVIAFTPPEARSFFETEAGPRYRLVAQGDGDLGQRLRRFVTDQLTHATD